MSNNTESTKWFTERDRSTGDVLLLEDDVDLQSVISNFLETQGYTVVVVSSGADGIRKILESDFGAIVCDMVMPAFPGDTFLQGDAQGGNRTSATGSSSLLEITAPLPSLISLNP